MFLMLSCSSNHNNNDSRISELSEDKIISVSTGPEGLLIKKNHSSVYTHVTIHIQKEGLAHENIGISCNEKINSFTYPFVQAGETYSVYLTMMKEDWTGYTSSKAAKITAGGGLGDYNISFSDYKYNQQKCVIEFSDYLITKPNIPVNGQQYSGNIYLDADWGKGVWGSYVFCGEDKAYIDLSSRAVDILNKKFFVQLTYAFSYKGINYTYTLLENPSAPFTDFHPVTGISLSQGFLRPMFSPNCYDYVIYGTNDSVTINATLVSGAAASSKTISTGESTILTASYQGQEINFKFTFEKAQEITFTDSKGKSQKYIETFYDDFDGNELDSTKWHKSAEQERQQGMKDHGWWKNECSYIEDGKLVIESRKEGDSLVSGSIETSGIFEQTRGIYEIRFKCQKTSGLWYAFWLMDNNNDTAHIGNGAVDAAEIDIFELVPNEPYHGPNYFKTTINYDAYGAAHQADSSPNANIDDSFYDNWHIAKFVWGKEAYELYLDEELLYVMEGEDYGGMCEGKNYMIVSAEFGEWGGSVKENLLPARMYVDWIKAYGEL